MNFEEDLKILGEPLDFLSRSQKLQLKKLLKEYSPKTPRERKNMEKDLQNAEFFLEQERNSEAEYGQMLYSTGTYGNIGMMTARIESITFEIRVIRAFRRILKKPNAESII